MRLVGIFFIYKPKNIKSTQKNIFLLAAEKMQVSASDCIIIEDSLEGIRGGKNAGMKVFAFCGAKANNNPEYKHKCLLVGADKVFDNMEHLHTELIKLQN